MSRRLERTVVLADPVTGTPVTYEAGCTVDDETAARIKNPKVWESAPAPSGDDAPPTEPEQTSQADDTPPAKKAPAKKAAPKKRAAKK